MELSQMPKDCECITHEGPHFLHMDEYERLANLELLKAAQAHLTPSCSRIDAIMGEACLRRFYELELVRLKAKREWMLKMGVY